jgi:transcription antitermination factor NusG
LATQKKWYVVYTKPRWEKKIADALVSNGIEQYCPLNKVTKQWSDRKKIVLEPLFKGYLFVCPPKDGKWDIKKIPGILNYVHWLGKPAVVRDAEINIIRKFLNEFSDVEVTEQHATINETVVIKQGIFMNYKGLVLEIIDNKARVRIEAIGVSLTAVFERKNLVKVGSR